MLTVVTGPPCAGKTTHVTAHANPGDITIDLDQLAQTLGSPDTHDHPPATLAVAAAARHGAIGEAIRQHRRRGATVWIVDAAPTAARRAQYDTAGATWIRLTADRTELHRRATTAGRGDGTHRRIDAWRDGQDTAPASASRAW